MGDAARSLTVRRLLLVATIASWLGAGCATAPASADAGDFERFLDRVDSAQRELQQGRPEAYKSLWSRGSDVTLGGGFGGGFERGWDGVSKRLDWAGSQFSSARNEIQRIAFSASGDLGYLVQSERIHYTAPNSSAPLERSYRVTMLFRREQGQWRIIHRHADTQTTREASR